MLCWKVFAPGHSRTRRSWSSLPGKSKPVAQGVYVMTSEERAAVREGLEQARRGEFVSDDEMAALWKKYKVV